MRPEYLREWRDPALVYEERERRTCKGCAHIDEVLGKKFCKKGKRMTKKCGLYRETE